MDSDAERGSAARLEPQRARKASSAASAQGLIFARVFTSSVFAISVS